MVECETCLKVAPAFAGVRQELVYDGVRHGIMLAYQCGDPNDVAVTFAHWVSRPSRCEHLVHGMGGAVCR